MEDESRDRAYGDEGEEESCAKPVYRCLIRSVKLCSVGGDRSESEPLVWISRGFFFFFLKAILLKTFSGVNVTPRSIRFEEDSNIHHWEGRFSDAAASCPVAPPVLLVAAMCVSLCVCMCVCVYVCMYVRYMNLSPMWPFNPDLLSYRVASYGK